MAPPQKHENRIALDDCFLEASIDSRMSAQGRTETLSASALRSRIGCGAGRAVSLETAHWSAVNDFRRHWLPISGELVTA